MSTNASIRKNTGSNKRRKTFYPDTSANISGLSNDNLIAIADFLPKTSRAILAVALTAPASSWRDHGWKEGPSEASKLITSSVTRSAPFSSLIHEICREDEMGERCRLRWSVSVSQYKKSFEASLGGQLHEYYEGQWEILDFVDIGRGLASRLTDDDLSAILVCIDAKNNLKRLKLTHCFNIAGHGLGPLRCSTVLEKIDMSLVRQFEAPEMFDFAKISEEIVFDILDSVISMQENSFRRLQLPMRWWEWSGNDVIPGEGLTRFVGKYNHILNKRSICCYFGFAGNVNDFLEQMNGVDQDLVDTCIDCASCINFDACVDCNKILCAQCECHCVFSCAICHVKSCNVCVENPTVFYCTNDKCGFCCCDKCRLSECKEGINNCDGCRSWAFDKILEESEKLKEENERLRHDLAQLRL